MAFTLVNLINTFHRGKDWEVHESDCSAIRRKLRTGADIDHTADTLEAIAEWYNEAYGVDAGYEDPWVFDRDVHRAPCVRRG